MKDEEKNFKCPICKKPALRGRKKNPYFPFCTERCRAIDLGAWLDEKYAIASEEPFIDTKKQ